MSFHWSFSRLKTYEGCHAKFDYQYNQKLDRGATGPAAQRGIDIHRAIEDSLHGRSDVPTESGHVSNVIEAVRISAAPHHIEFNLHLDREWKRVITGDYWHHSVLDLLVFPEPNLAVIRDWKTGKIYPDHDQQKELYALDVFCAYPEVQEVQTYWDYLDQGKTVARTFFPIMVDAAKERWGRRAERMEKQTEFIPMPGWPCRWCNYSTNKGGPCRF